MAGTKALDFYDLSGSEEEDNEVYDSEDEVTKGRSVQKPALDEDDDEDDEPEEDDESEIEEAEEDEDEEGNAKMVPLTKAQIEKNQEKIRKSGVVYISRIPPYMKPIKMRQIMSRFGEVNRIFLAPEDPKAYARRVKYGGNKKKSYTEGWAEFVRKKDAKLASDTLNGNTIGGKKGSYYYDDILNVKYLHKFKWHNLTEQIALEAQSRHEKLRAEIAQATRENKIFIENVERHKMIEGMQKKRSAKESTEDGDSKGKDEPVEMRRNFAQRKTFSRRADDDEGSRKKRKEELDNTVSRVLSKVF